MADLPKEILAEEENVENALKNLQEAAARPEKTVIELSAIAVFLHNIYNGIENILMALQSSTGLPVGECSPSPEGRQIQLNL